MLPIAASLIHTHAICLVQALPSSGGGNAQLPFAQAAALLARPPSLGAVRAAQAWAKATYLVCLAGHLAPLRPAWFTNLYHPSHAPAACPQPHCRVPTCRGNIFYRLASDQYGVRIGHHKTSSHSSQKDLPPIQFVIPPNVCTWLHIYFEYCHPLLADEVSCWGKPSGLPRELRPACPCTAAAMPGDVRRCVPFRCWLGKRW